MQLFENGRLENPSLTVSGWEKLGGKSWRLWLRKGKSEWIGEDDLFVRVTDQNDC